MMRFHKAFFVCLQNVIRIVLAMGVAAVFAVAHADTWPIKAVRVVVPFTPGGPTDVLARLISQRLSQVLGQPFVIDNKGGAGGTIGAAEVARSSADGYTLLFTTSSTHAISPHLMKVPYQGSDFTPIAHVADAPLVLLVPSSLNVKTVSEFITLARRQPGQLHYSTSGNGTISHLTMEDFRARTEVDIVPVPYKGGGPAMQDLMGGSVQALFSAVPGVMGLVKSGRIRAIGITSLHRSPLARDLPTVAELGVPGFSSVAWFGFYGPRSLDPAIVARINNEINKLLQSPEVISALAAQGAEPGRGSPSDFAAMVAKDSEHWAKIIRDRKITLQ